MPTTLSSNRFLSIDLKGDLKVFDSNFNRQIWLNGTTGDISMNGNLYIKDVNILTNNNYFTKTGNNIYYNSGNVGIGTSTPTASLDVNGLIKSPHAYTTLDPFIGVSLFTIPKTKILFNQSNTNITLGSFQIQPNTEPQKIKLNIPINTYLKTQSPFSNLPITLTSVSFQINKGTSIYSIPTTTTNNSLPTTKGYKWLKNPPSLQTIEQYITNASCEFVTTKTTTTETYTVYIKLIFPTPATTGLYNEGGLYLNSLVSTQSTTGYYSAINGSGIKYSTGYAYIIKYNDLASGTLVCNNLLVNNIYYDTLTQAQINTSNTVKLNAPLLATTTSNTTNGILVSTGENDNYNYSIIGDVCSNIIYTTGSIAIPDNVSFIKIMGVGGGGGGGSGVLNNNPTSNLVGGAGGGGASYNEITYPLDNYGMNSASGCKVNYSVGSGGSGGQVTALNATTGYSGANGGNTTVTLNDESGNLIVTLFKTNGGSGGEGGFVGTGTSIGGAYGSILNIPTTVYNNAVNKGGSGTNTIGGTSSNSFYNCPNGGGGGCGITNVAGQSVAYSSSASNVGSKNGIPVDLSNNGNFGYGSNGISSTVGRNIPISGNSADFGGGGGGGDSSVLITNSVSTNSLSFNGTNQYGSLSSSTFYDYSAGTIECWIKSTATGTVGWIIGKPFQFVLTLTYGKISTYSWGDNVSYNSTASVNDGNWHHIALTFNNGVVNGSSVYIDGVLSHNAKLTSTANTSNFVIGGQTTTQFFSGQIDEIRVWNYTRSASQISQNYKMRISPTTTGLTGYWYLDEGTGTTAYNAVSGQPNFTLTNSPTWNTNTATVYDPSVSTSIFHSNGGLNGGSGYLNISFF